jgi:hypothetical protein
MQRHEYKNATAYAFWTYGWRDDSSTVDETLSIGDFSLMLTDRLLTTHHFKLQVVLTFLSTRLFIRT